jgi:hypothetical protein
MTCQGFGKPEARKNAMANVPTGINNSSTPGIPAMVTIRCDCDALRIAVPMVSTPSASANRAVREPEEARAWVEINSSRIIARIGTSHNHGITLEKAIGVGVIVCLENAPVNVNHGSIRKVKIKPDAPATIKRLAEPRARIVTSAISTPRIR